MARLSKTWKDEREQDELDVTVFASQTNAKSGGKVKFSTSFLRQVAMKRLAADIAAGRFTSDDLIKLRNEEKAKSTAPVPV